MQGAPHFVKWPDSVNGMWKIDFLRWLGKITGITTLVETGTCEGITPWNLRNDFREMHTIELHDGLYQASFQRLKNLDHVHLYHGSSRTMLASIIEMSISGPAIFWLDAHSSGPHTADDGDPLSDELRQIISRRPDALIVIDDMRGIGEFSGQVDTVDLTGWHVEYRTGEIMLYQEGRYNIPPFEEGLWWE
jgi:hypothetical protein